ncbi:hypothetical protein SEA_ERENYEAGER_25 [Microbacterium phage Erenyeager]|nr:hypothetical protein SEA_ERENYEAGER_25 [Microbacterium phage Erenyeager]
MSDKRIIPPALVVQTLELGIPKIDAQISETLTDIDTLQESYAQACRHLDNLRERRDQYTQVIRLLQ